MKNDFKTRFLANTFYNPAVSVDLEWHLLGNVCIEGLKADVCAAVNNDKHDLIAMHEEADVIKRQINACESFNEVLDTIVKLVLPHLA